jgi:hypothetical protein
MGQFFRSRRRGGVGAMVVNGDGRRWAAGEGGSYGALR